MAPRGDLGPASTYPCPSLGGYEEHEVALGLGEGGLGGKAARSAGYAGQVGLADEGVADSGDDAFRVGEQFFPGEVDDLVSGLSQ
jgi:hypothetical protein